MKKTLLFSIILLFFATACRTQNEKLSKDFNKDGTNDTAEITKDSGSSYSSTSVEYWDGKTKKKVEFSLSYSFGSFFAIGNIPNLLGKSGGLEIGKLLFYSKPSSKIDPSLQWLIDASSNLAAIRADGMIDFATKYSPVWTEGKPTIPANYWIQLESAKYPNLLKNVESSPEYDLKAYKSDYIWIDYYPHNHGEEAALNTVRIDTTHQLFTSTHGVLLRDGSQKYSWIFINDDKLFEANEKLRWPSISQATFFHEFVYIRHIINNGNSHLFIVHPDTGIVIRLNNERMGLAGVEKIEIGEEWKNLTITDSEGKSYSLTIEKIRELVQLD